MSPGLTIKVRVQVIIPPGFGLNNKGCQGIVTFFQLQGVILRHTLGPTSKEYQLSF